MEILKSAKIFASFLIIFFSASSFSDAIGGGIGINGVDINYQKPISDKLSVRFLLTYAPLEKDFKKSQIEYTLKYDRTNLGTLFDFHPFTGAFHVSGGLYVLDHNWNLDAKGAGKYNIGNTTYESTDLSLKAQIAFAKASPYIGFGWGNSIAGTGFTFNIDLGALFIGSPTVNYKTAGHVKDASTGISVDVNSNADFQNDLEKERVQIEHDLKDFSTLPVLQLGLAYKF